MERYEIDDDRAARLAKVRSELVHELSPVRGDLSDENFARALSLLARSVERAEHERLRNRSPASG
jgi:hypothetical protein